ncbi:hypothetical protein OH76DRAFT_1410072 [Lentinus brumalis]|uniref:Uncharacterized protein n=1 Tax=Lentinus brumalis TaxID=2498619 RepID=A0A371CTD6_9APHY|nr:hypothetical protein OH76DRAFT_1410072 [Polyporus brumalis]
MPVWRTSPEPRPAPPPPPPPSPLSAPLHEPTGTAGYPLTSILPGTYPGTILLPGSPRAWHTTGCVLWSFVWLLPWSALTTAGGKLVVDESTHKSVSNSLFVVALLCGSAILSVPLAIAADLVGMAVIPLCAYFVSFIVPPVGVIFVRSLLHAGPTVLEGFWVGAAGWVICTLAFWVFMACMALVSTCFVHDFSHDY